MWTKLVSVPVIALAFVSSGCESLGDLGSSGGSQTQPQAIASNVNGTGTIQSVEVVPRSQGLGLGTLAGAAIGGVLGNQVGGGTGKSVTTVAGAAGGAVDRSEAGTGGRRPALVAGAVAAALPACT